MIGHFPFIDVVEDGDMAMWAGPAGAPAAAMVDRSRTISRSLSPMPQSQFSIWSCLINEPRCPCERIAENFNDNLAVEWNNKGRKLEQPHKLGSQHFDTLVVISGCKCPWSSTTVAVGMWHTFAQKDSVFLGCSAKTLFIHRPATPFGRSLSPSGYGLERFGS